MGIKEQHLIEKERAEKEKARAMQEISNKELYQQRQDILARTEKAEQLEKTLEILKAELDYKNQNVSTKEIELEKEKLKNAQKLNQHKEVIEQETKTAYKDDFKKLADQKNRLINEEQKLSEKEEILAIREDKILKMEDESRKLLEDFEHHKKLLSEKNIENNKLERQLNENLSKESENAKILIRDQQEKEAKFKAFNNDLKNMMSFRSNDQKESVRSMVHRAVQSGILPDSCLEAFQDSSPLIGSSTNTDNEAFRSYISKGQQLGYLPKMFDVGVTAGQQPPATGRRNDSELNESQFSVSSFVDGMKKRVDNLETEAGLLNEQYESYKSGILK